MARWSNFVALAALVVTIALVFAVADRGPRVAAQSAQAGTGTPSTITVLGEGRVDATPDVGWLTVGVQTMAPTAQEAHQQNAEQMNQVVTSLRGLEVGERDLRTSGLSLSPVFTRPGEITGYRAQNNLTITVRDLSRAGELFDAAVAAGANTGGSVSFGLADPSAVRHQALAAAIADARAQAEAVARAASLHVRGIRTITEEGVSLPPPRPLPAIALPAAERATPIQPGEQQVTARVRVVFDF